MAGHKVQLTGGPRDGECFAVAELKDHLEFLVLPPAYSMADFYGGQKLKSLQYERELPTDVTRYRFIDPDPPTHPLAFADRKLKAGWRFSFECGDICVRHPDGGAFEVLSVCIKCHCAIEDVEQIGEAIAAMLNGEWVPRTKGE